MLSEHRCSHEDHGGGSVLSVCGRRRRTLYHHLPKHTSSTTQPSPAVQSQVSRERFMLSKHTRAHPPHTNTEVVVCSLTPSSPYTATAMYPTIRTTESPKNTPIDNHYTECPTSIKNTHNTKNIITNIYSTYSNCYRKCNSVNNTVNCSPVMSSPLERRWSKGLPECNNLSNTPSLSCSSSLNTIISSLDTRCSPHTSNRRRCRRLPKSLCEDSDNLTNTQQLKKSPDGNIQDIHQKLRIVPNTESNMSDSCQNQCPRTCTVLVSSGESSSLSSVSFSRSETLKRCWQVRSKNHTQDTINTIPNSGRSHLDDCLKSYSSSILQGPGSLLSFIFNKFKTTGTANKSSRLSAGNCLSLLYVLLCVFLLMPYGTDACSSRSTPRPRPSSTTLRPNITFQTYACPPAYAAWYCLNGATCFTVKISQSILYNCECPEGYMGQRCEYKDLDGSYLPARDKVLLETASLAGGAAALLVLCVVGLVVLMLVRHSTVYREFVKYWSEGGPSTPPPSTSKPPLVLILPPYTPHPTKDKTPLLHHDSTEFYWPHTPLYSPRYGSLCDTTSSPTSIVITPPRMDVPATHHSNIKSFSSSPHFFPTTYSTPPPPYTSSPSTTLNTTLSSITTSSPPPSSSFMSGDSRSYSPPPLYHL